MAIGYGPRIVTDGLVSCLDKYNERSYLGEPTVNLMTNPTFQNETVGSNAAIGWGVGYSGTDNYYDDNPPEGNLYFGLYCGTPNVYQSHATITNLAASTTYTISYWVKTSTPHGALNNAMYVYGNADGAVMAPVYASTTEWQKKSHVFTTFSTAQSYDINSYNYVAGMTVYISGIQIEEKSHATKFVNGTRGATDGWQDLSGNNNHANLTQLSYSATNVPGTNMNNFVLDGVDDYLRIDQIDSTKVTISFWLYFDTLPGTGAYFVPIRQGYDPINFSIYIPDTDEIQFYAIGSNGNTGLTGTGYTVSAGTWYNIVKTIDWDTNEWALYVNGALEFGTVSFPSSFLSYSFNNTTNNYNYTDISRNVTNNNSFIDGEIGSLLIHNKILTATEVLQNYNAYKGRFGL